jgi:hypothetical protein
MLIELVGVEIDLAGRRHFIDAAVGNPADAIRTFEHLQVVGCRNNRDAQFVAEPGKQLDDLLAGERIEVDP